MSLDDVFVDDVFVDAERQLNICNSCRYCEGYCAVWPALELRIELTEGDLTHLANLCHDCRDCFTACMYTAPHEFDLNPPKVFAEIRERSYRSYVWPGRVPGPLRGFRGGVVASVVVGLILLGLSFLTEGGRAFGFRAAASPYALLPYWLTLLVALLPAAFTVVVGIVALTRYWADTHGALRDLGSARLWGRALAAAGRLRHMRGGGEQECSYPDEAPTAVRRRYHALTFYGFLLCFAATIVAGIQQDFLGMPPPYPLLSVPVLLGTIGGTGMVVGCVGLAVLKRRADPGQTTDSMAQADHGLLGALLVLAVTGLLTLILRESVLFGVVLLIHLAAIVVCFVVAPYTKFVHGFYRLLAIYQDEWEHARQRSAR